jgi:hypothetical protein
MLLYTKYFIAFFISSVFGLIAKSVMYNTQFTISNPGASVRSYTVDQMNDSMYRTNRSNIYE